VKLLVEIDGQTMPLARCFWVRADDSGCVYGSLHGDQVTNADDAHKQFVPRRRDRDRDIQQGWTIRLLTREQWKEQAEPCFLGRCNHRKEAAA
jgi:hypothetical protein